MRRWRQDNDTLLSYILIKTTQRLKRKRLNKLTFEDLINRQMIKSGCCADIKQHWDMNSNEKCTKWLNKWTVKCDYRWLYMTVMKLVIWLNMTVEWTSEEGVTCEISGAHRTSAPQRICCRCDPAAPQRWATLQTRADPTGGNSYSQCLRWDKKKCLSEIKHLSINAGLHIMPGIPVSEVC